MYMVVSRWRAKPGKEDEFIKAGKGARAFLRSQPGVKMVESFDGGDSLIAVHAYEDEAAYQRIVTDENGPFAKMAAENNLKELGEWLGSDKGETIDG
jgi:heme-degrading monooxygenase HmoA